MVVRRPRRPGPGAEIAVNAKRSWAYKLWWGCSGVESEATSNGAGRADDSVGIAALSA